jgi:hypothetical protein
MNYVKNAAFVLAVFALVALVQSQYQLPVVGAYLPGGKA